MILSINYISFKKLGKKNKTNKKRDRYKQVYAKEMDNLENLDKFLKGMTFQD